MIDNDVRVSPSKADLKREDQLAWKIAGVAADKVAVTKEVSSMIVNRVIDNAAVAIASANRRPIVSARDMALARPNKIGASVFGVASTKRVCPEWAAWANGVAVRELDMHDTFLAADYSHPGDNIPPILAVAQTLDKSGKDLIRGIATGYEIQIDLVRGICLHEHKIDHIAQRDGQPIDGVLVSEEPGQFGSQVGMPGEQGLPIGRLAELTGLQIGSQDFVHLLLALFIRQNGHGRSSRSSDIPV